MSSNVFWMTPLQWGTETSKHEAVTEQTRGLNLVCGVTMLALRLGRVGLLQSLIEGLSVSAFKACSQSLTMENTPSASQQARQRTGRQARSGGQQTRSVSTT